MPSGLVGFWPLHDESAQDLSGNGNHGTLNGGVTTGVAGRGGLEAMSFDGSDDAVDIPNFGNFSSYTVSYWMKPENTASSEDVVSIRGNNGILHRVANGGITFFHDTGSANEIIGGTSLQEDEWVYITQSWGGSIAKAYVNGSLIDSVNISTNSSDSKGDSLGGNLFDNQRYFDGIMSDVRVYNRALSEREIQTLYEWGSADTTDPSLHNGQDAGAFSRWDFDGNLSDRWNTRDLSGTANFTTDGYFGKGATFGASDYVSVGDIIPDSVASRPVDTSVDNNTLTQGLKFTVNSDWRSIGARISNNTSGVTRAYLWDSGRNEIDSVDISGLTSGDPFTFTNVNLTAGNDYYIVVDAEGGPHDTGFDGGDAYPFTSTDVDIIARWSGTSDQATDPIAVNDIGNTGF